MSWLANNYKWILDGLGVAIPLALIGWWLESRQSDRGHRLHRIKQRQRGGKNSINLQSAHDLKVEMPGESDAAK